VSQWMNNIEWSDYARVAAGGFDGKSVISVTGRTHQHVAVTRPLDQHAGRFIARIFDEPAAPYEPDVHAILLLYRIGLRLLCSRLLMKMSNKKWCRHRVKFNTIIKHYSRLVLSAGSRTSITHTEKHQKIVTLTSDLWPQNSIGF